jgi:hypothetical protein
MQPARMLGRSGATRGVAMVALLVIVGAILVATAPAKDGDPGPDPSTPWVRSPGSPAGGVRLAYPGDASGTSDVTEDLQRFIDAAPDGSTVAFEPAGTYRLDCTVWIRHRIGLTFDGRGARFFAPPGADCVSQTIWRFNAGGGHVIRDMTIEGSHPRPGTYEPPREFQVGVESMGTVGLEILDVTVRRTMGDCVLLGHDNQPGGQLEWSENVRIAGLDCSLNGRQGVAVTGGRNILIERSRFSDQAYIVFDLEPDEPPGGAHSVTIRDNVIAGLVDSPVLSIGGAGLVSNVLLEGNTVVGGENHGIWVVVEQRDGHRPRSIVIRDNRGEEPFAVPDSAPFRIRSADDVTIQGNRQVVIALPPVMVDIDDSCAVTVADNTPMGLFRDGTPGQSCSASGP